VTDSPSAPDTVGFGDELDDLLGGYEGTTAEANDQQAAEVELAEQLTPRPAVVGAPSAPLPGIEAKAVSSKRWLLWWIPSILLPPFGGVAAWFALRTFRREEAAVMFWVSLAIGFVATMALMIYAEPLAKLMTGTNANTVIYVK
jgi:hypothetical protein